MSGSMSSEASAEPNLTPMLDLVFQLITFFMLVTNFKAASLDLNLKLPVVGSARPLETEGEDLLILNIDAEGNLNVYGVTQKNVDHYIKAEAKVSRSSAKRLNPNFKADDDLPTTIVVRADQKTPFNLLNKVIKSCQDNGFRKFALKAMNKADG
jgi:biopolymer transport protein ExbD